MFIELTRPGIVIPKKFIWTKNIVMKVDINKEPNKLNP